MAEDSQDGSEMNRRRALASMTATSAAIGGLGVGTASASEQEIVSTDSTAYDSVAAVEQLLEEHQDALEAAHELGALDAPRVDELGIETLGRPSTDDDATVAFSAKRTVSGETPLVTIQKETDAGFLDITLRPEKGTASASLFSDDGTSDVWCGGKSCDDDCDCNVTCFMVNNSATCPNRSGRGWDVNYSCDCNDGW